jgi:hypothetical protein
MSTTPRCAICVRPLGHTSVSVAVHAKCIRSCPHPIADQKIIGSIVGPVFRKPGDLQVSAVTLRCARCGEHTTVTTPRTDPEGTDAQTPTSENVHAP